MAQRMPFKVSREIRTSLIEQVANGLRSAILAGHYRAGDTLPNLHEMAAALGVSEIVTRRAVRRLADEGLLNPRRGTGIAVCGDELRTWHGHVLYVHWSGSNMFYHNVLSGVMVNRLHAAGMLVSTLHVDGTDRANDFARAQAELGHVVSLTVIEGYADGLDTLLAARRIPFIHIHGRDTSCSSLAVQGIAADHAAALKSMQKHCRSRGVRSVLQVRSCQDNAFIAAFTFDESVFTVTSLPSFSIPGLDSPESVERGALTAMQQWLDQRSELPDLIWFDDDFVARGALLVLTAYGVRIPDDVQVVSWANKGLGPVFLKPLTRVEMDPKAHGEIVARRILDHLGNKPPTEREAVLAPSFIVGETTRSGRSRSRRPCATRTHGA